MSNVCTYCKKSFATVASLTKHGKTAKYCLYNRENNSIVTCEQCKKNFVSVHCLDAHKTKCNKSLVIQVHDLKMEISCLKNELNVYKELAEKDSDRLFEIAKQPKTLTNNKTVTNNKVSILTPLDLSQERLKDLVEANFTNSHMLEGQKGIARFTVEHVIKDEDGKLRYICTDPARHTFRFKEGDTEIKDIRGKRLSTALAPPVIDKSSRLGMEAIRANPELFAVYSDTLTKIKDVGSDDAEFRGELASMIV